MYCSKCGALNADDARACGNCGAALAVSRPSPEAAGYVERPRAPATPKRSIWPFVAVIALVLIALGVVAALRAMRSNTGLAKAPDTSPGGTGLTQAPGVSPAGPPVTQSPNAPANEPGLTQSLQPTGLPPAPPGTDDYLRWLYQKELERQRIYGEMQHAIQMAAMQAGVEWARGMGQMMEPGGLGDVEETNQNIQKQTSAFDQEVGKLEALAREFTYKIPPESCRQVHERYSGMLGKWVGSMKKVQRAMTNADFTDLPAGGVADRDIEDAIADTDRELGAVYDRYAISDPPRFHIEDKGASAGGPFSTGR
jgi:hypothetical protein